LVNYQRRAQGLHFRWNVIWHHSIVVGERLLHEWNIVSAISSTNVHFVEHYRVIGWCYAIDTLRTMQLRRQLAPVSLLLGANHRVVWNIFMGHVAELWVESNHHCGTVADVQTNNVHGVHQASKRLFALQT
jgi:hypothetical protein